MLLGYSPTTTSVAVTGVPGHAVPIFDAEHSVRPECTRARCAPMQLRRRRRSRAAIRCAGKRTSAAPGISRTLALTAEHLAFMASHTGLRL